MFNVVNTNAILDAIKSGEARVNVLTHTGAFGKPADIKDELIRLVYERVIESYDDGRRVRLV